MPAVLKEEQEGRSGATGARGWWAGGEAPRGDGQGEG